jgi:phospholipid-binding lipoprotein MlaA
MNYVLRRITGLLLIAALAGCATSNNPQDPFESFNRTMFSFNDALDQAVLKPVATVYRNATPAFVQTGVGNFFGNIGDIWTAVNNLLQGKANNGLSDIMRVAMNTVFGVGGLLDIGSEAGLPKHKEDFGETLGVWGFGPGPYLVLPFLGSTTMRDTLALPVDFAGDLWTYKRPVRVRNSGSVVRVIDSRAAVLDASNLIEDAALDRYEFIRDAYLQRRANKIDDGYNSAPDKGEKSAGEKGAGEKSGGDKPKSDKSSANESSPPDAAATQTVAAKTPEPATGSTVQQSSGGNGNMQGSGSERQPPQLPTEGMTAPRAPSSELPV